MMWLLSKSLRPGPVLHSPFVLTSPSAGGLVEWPLGGSLRFGPGDLAAVSLVGVSP